MDEFGYVLLCLAPYVALFSSIYQNVRLSKDEQHRCTVAFAGTEEVESWRIASRPLVLDSEEALDHVVFDDGPGQGALEFYFFGCKHWRKKPCTKMKPQKLLEFFITLLHPVKRIVTSYAIFLPQFCTEMGGAKPSL